jgi:hypothetical protein
MISNKNFINYKVLNLVELYNFDINFIFIRLHLKNMNLFVLQLFLRMFDLVNRSKNHSVSKNCIFRDGWHKQTSLKIEFLEAVLLTEPPLKMDTFLEADFLREPPLKMVFQRRSRSYGAPRRC